MEIPNEKSKEYFPETLRMRAYYYGFKETGVREVDELLSAVAIAGKAFHSTDQWQDEVYDEEFSVVDLIQDRANVLAEKINTNTLTK